MILMGEWGFPLSPKDLRMLVAEFLNAKGLTTRFGKDNMPGKDWMAGFLKRHPGNRFKNHGGGVKISQKNFE